MTAGRGYIQKKNVVRSARCRSAAAASTVMVSTTSKQARWLRIGDTPSHRFAYFETFILGSRLRNQNYSGNGWGCGGGCDRLPLSTFDHNGNYQDRGYRVSPPFRTSVICGTVRDVVLACCDLAGEFHVPYVAFRLKRAILHSPMRRGGTQPGTSVG